MDPPTPRLRRGAFPIRKGRGWELTGIYFTGMKGMKGMAGGIPGQIHVRASILSSRRHENPLHDTGFDALSLSIPSIPFIPVNPG